MAGNGKRVEKVNSEILRIVSETFRRGEIFDTRGYMISVVYVDVSPDLSHADIAVSIYGCPASERKSVIREISASAGKIRSVVARSMTMRHVPELHFKLDDSMEYGAHITSIINGLNITPESEDDTPSGI